MSVQRRCRSVTSSRPGTLRFCWIVLGLLVCAQTVTARPFADYDGFENNDFDDDFEDDDDDDDEFGFGDVYDFGEEDEEEGEENMPGLKHDTKQSPGKGKKLSEALYSDHEDYRQSANRKVKSGLFSDDDQEKPYVAGRSKLRDTMGREGGVTNVKRMSYKAGDSHYDGDDTVSNHYDRSSRQEALRKSPFQSDGRQFHGASPQTSGRLRYKPAYDTDFNDRPAHAAKVSKVDGRYNIERDYYEDVQEVPEQDMTTIANYREARREKDGLHFFSSHNRPM